MIHSQTNSRLIHHRAPKKQRLRFWGNVGVSRELRASRGRLALLGSSVLLTAAASAMAETDITLGGDLGFSAVVGLSKEGEAFDHETFASITLDIEHSTDYGLLFGGKISLRTVNELRVSAYDYTDPNGIEEHRLFRVTAPGPTNITARVYGLSGLQDIESADIVAVKINSDWQSLGNTRSLVQNPIPPVMAQNVCKLAGRLADDMNGKAANFSYNAAGQSAAPVFKTTVGNGLMRDTGSIFLANGGATGGLAPAGQFLAKRVIWASSTIATTASISPPTVLIPRPQPIGARISVRPHNPATRPGAAAAVFQTRFQTVKIKPEDVTSSSFPQIVYQSTASGSATVLFDPGPDEQDQKKVNFAQVYVGPFAEIRTIGSSEKLVTGVVCLEQNPFENETNAFLQPASKMLGQTGASIYIEGGFGKVTLSTDDFAGLIESDGPWADKVSLSADDNFILSADAAMAGVQASLAVKPQLGSRALDTIAGAKVDLGGISIATDIHFDPTIAGFLDAWQLEAALSPSAFSSFGLIFDSDDKWWMEGELGSAAFYVKAQAGLPTDYVSGQPVYWWMTSALNLNGGTLSAEYDQRGDLAFEVTMPVSAGEVFARVEQEDDIVNLRFGSQLEF